MTHYAFSEPFQIKSGETFIIGDLTFTDIPPPFPDALKMSVDELTLNAIARTTQLYVTGVLDDGSEIDVTPRTAWTIYRTSNPDIVTVGENGLVTATGAGTAFMTAVNKGTTAVKRTLVVQGYPLTTVEGFVRLEDDTPVEGADVTLLTMSEITDIDGFSQITWVSTQLGSSLNVRASAFVNSESFRGTKEITTIVPGGITDAGILSLRVQGILFGSSSIQGTNPGSLFEIDTTTGEAILIGTPVNTANGLSDVQYGNTLCNAWCCGLLTLNSDTGEVISRVPVSDPFASLSGSGALALDLSGNLLAGTKGRILKIHPATDIVLSDVNVTGGLNYNHLSDLAVDPTTGLVWAGRGGNFPGRLVVVDPDTGVVTFLLDIVTCDEITTVAFDNNGTPFASLEGNQLAIIDKSTGAVTPIATGFGEPKISGLGF